MWHIVAFVQYNRVRNKEQQVVQMVQTEATVTKVAVGSDRAPATDNVSPASSDTQRCRGRAVWEGTSTHNIYKFFNFVWLILIQKS